ncbi:MAG: hypothetical protein DI565_16060 [Ancylobacter novellus]|uniref:Uncharacterized protein n=1 Tax=Ancylobacter novellus TaxID=921 RepID=A0A2W5K9T2_ANCNO|nr:MAG: hypothetical protein DI565_16060 [Ancylobacter novellus]
MKWRDREYDVEIRQEIDVASLAEPEAGELEEAEETGQLAGNGMYQDLSGLGLDDLQATLARENEVIARLSAAEDLEAAAEAFDDERAERPTPAEELWGLDIGVAAATVALSVLGATPVASCNAGGFGGVHQSGHPYVAAFIPADQADALVMLAREADVGVRTGSDGLVRVYGRSDLALVRFAEVVLSRLREAQLRIRLQPPDGS